MNGRINTFSPFLREVPTPGHTPGDAHQWRLLWLRESRELLWGESLHPTAAESRCQWRKQAKQPSGLLAKKATLSKEFCSSELLPPGVLPKFHLQPLLSLCLSPWGRFFFSPLSFESILTEQSQGSPGIWDFSFETPLSPTLRGGGPMCFDCK